MDYINKVNGKRLYLSISKKEDISLYNKWLNDPELNLGFGKSHNIHTEERQQQYIDDYNNSDDKFLFPVILKETQEPIGILLLYEICYIHGNGKLAILIDQKHQAKGYGKEAINLLLEFAFNILNLNNVILEVIEFNKNAIKAYNDIGFQTIGRRRNSYHINNQSYDEIYMDILKTEYNQKKNSEIKS